MQQTLALHRDLGDQGVQADALNGLGRVYWLTADYPAAVTCLQQSLEPCSAISVTGALKPKPLITGAARPKRSTDWAPCSA